MFGYPSILSESITSYSFKSVSSPLTLNASTYYFSTSSSSKEVHYGGIIFTVMEFFFQLGTSCILHKIKWLVFFCFFLSEYNKDSL